jgi:hypothetical protein
LQRENDSNRSARLIKTDSKGVVEWETTSPRETTRPHYTDLISVQQTSDGGYIAAGDIGVGAGVTYGWLIKIDSKGVTEWERTFESPAYFNQVQQTNDGGYIVVGGMNGSLIKTDSKGIREWERTFKGSDGFNGIFDGISSVQETTDGGYILVGNRESSQGKTYGRLIKTDSKGIEEWEKSFEDGLEDNSVEQTTDGGYIMAGTKVISGSKLGSTGADYGWLIKTDSKGGREWDKIFSDAYWSNLHSAKQTTDGGYILVGTTVLDKARSCDGLLIKLKGQNR